MDTLILRSTPMQFTAVPSWRFCTNRMHFLIEIRTVVVYRVTFHREAFANIPSNWNVSLLSSTIQLDPSFAHLDSHPSVVSLMKDFREWHVANMDFLKGLTDHTTVSLGRTGDALQLLRLQGLRCSIIVVHEMQSVRADLAFSDRDSLLVLRAVETGHLSYRFGYRESEVEPVHVTHRIFPFWGANARRAWTVRNAARCAAGQLSQIGCFFLWLLTE